MHLPEERSNRARRETEWSAVVVVLSSEKDDSRALVVALGRGSSEIPITNIADRDYYTVEGQRNTKQCTATTYPSRLGQRLVDMCRAAHPQGIAGNPTAYIVASCPTLPPWEQFDQ